jgi:hypothetical protein
MSHPRCHQRLSAILPVLALLAACGETGTATSGTGKAATVKSVSRPAPPPKPAPRLQPAPGLEGVIGASPEAVIRQFGQPRLDVREEDARKLQWSGTACILDVFFYPPPGGGQQAATYVEARRGDGREVDRAACVAALRQP